MRSDGVRMCVCVSMVQGKLQSFLIVASQTLESFVKSLDDEMKTQTEDPNSSEHQFVLALVGTITSECSSSDINCFTFPLWVCLP